MNLRFALKILSIASLIAMIASCGHAAEVEGLSNEMAALVEEYGADVKKAETAPAMAAAVRKFGNGLVSVANRARELERKGISSEERFKLDTSLMWVQMRMKKISEENPEKFIRFAGDSNVLQAVQDVSAQFEKMKSP